MAMLACPICDKQISDQAPLCPGCGHPFKPPRQCGHGWLIGCGCLLTAFFTFLMMIVIGLLIWIGLSLQMDGLEEPDPGSLAVTQSEENRYACQENLEELALVKDEWATEHDLKEGATIPSAETERIFAKISKNLICPDDDEKSPQTSYNLGPVGKPPTCKCNTKHNQTDEDEK